MSDAVSNARAEAVARVGVRRRALTELYGQLAGELEEIGHDAPAQVFAGLAGDVPEAEPVAAVPAGEGLAGESPARLSDFASPYDAWAFAVRNELELFHEIADLVSRAPGPEARLALERQAQEALDRAGDFRRERRIAFHVERLAEDAARFPDLNRIDLHADLVHVALAVERWIGAFLAAALPEDERARAAVEITDTEIRRLEPVAEAAPAARRLARPLKRLQAASERAVPQSLAPAAAPGRALAEAKRVFDYYDGVFEAAREADVLAEAQRLSRSALERVQALRLPETAGEP